MGTYLSTLPADALLVPVPVLTGAISTPKSTAPTIQQSRLLSLPPELRNEIYRFALLSGRPVKVTKQLKPPALLSTCSEIRNEAIGIWYCEQELRLLVPDCDAGVATKFLAFAGSHIPKQTDWRNMSFNLSGQPNWANLMQWCQWVHSREVPAYEAAHVNRPLRKVVTAATSMAIHHQGQAWSQCQEVLNDFKPVAGMVDPQWLQD